MKFLFTLSMQLLIWQLTNCLTNPPRNLKATDVTSQRATIVWEPPIGGANSFEASISTLDNGEAAITPQFLSDSYVIFNGLYPGKRYTVSVKSFMEDKTEYGEETMEFTTVPLSPSLIRISKFVNPILNEYRNSKNQTMMYPVYGAVVFWSQTKDTLYDGFQLTVDPPNGQIRLPVTTNGDAEMQQRRIVWDMLPGINYKFTVQSISNGVLSNPTTAFERMPPEIPTTIKVSKLEPTSAILSWKAEHRGILDGFKVNMDPSDGDVQLTEMDPTFKERNLINLTPGTIYNAEVYSTSFGLMSFKPSQVKIITPPASPSNFKIEGSTDSSVDISWSKPTGNVDHYEVVYFPTARDFGRLRHKVQETRVNLENLEAGTFYTFLIYANANNKFSDANRNEAATRPVRPTGDLSCTSTADTVELEWATSDDDVTIVLTYNPVDDPSNKVSLRFPGNSDGSMVRELNPNTNYTLAMTVQKNQVQSFPVIQHCKTSSAARDSEPSEEDAKNELSEAAPTESTTTKQSTAESAGEATTTTTSTEATDDKSPTTTTTTQVETTTPTKSTESKIATTATTEGKAAESVPPSKPAKSESTTTTTTTKSSTTEQQQSAIQQPSTTTSTTFDTNQASTTTTTASFDSAIKEADGNSTKSPIKQPTSTQNQGVTASTSGNATTKSDENATSTFPDYDWANFDYPDYNASTASSINRTSSTTGASAQIIDSPSSTTPKTTTTTATTTEQTTTPFYDDYGQPYFDYEFTTAGPTQNSSEYTAPDTSTTTTTPVTTSSSEAETTTTIAKTTTTEETIPKSTKAQTEEKTIDIKEGFETICKPDNITVLVDKLVIDKYEKEYGPLQFNADTGDGCRGVEHDTYYRYTLATNILSCGTMIEVNETHVNFTNTVSNRDVRENWFSKMTDSTGTVLIGRRIGDSQPLFVNMKFYCTFPLDLSVTSQFPFLPQITQNIQTFNVSGFGEFSAIMQLYEDETYKVPYYQPPTLQDTETLYVGISLLQTKGVDIFTVVKKCWATPTRAHDDVFRYQLIEDYCPNTGSLNNELTILENGLSKRARWMGPVFRFISFDTVWLHCQVKVCFGSNCEKTCDESNSRSKRSIGEDLNPGGTIVSAGPISLRREMDNLMEKVENTTDDAPTTTKPLETASVNPTIILVIVVVLCVVIFGSCLVIIILTAKSRRRRRHGDKEIETLEHQPIDPVVGGSILPLSTLPRAQCAPATMTRISLENFNWEADSCYYETASPVKSGGANSGLPWIPRYSDVDGDAPGTSRDSPRLSSVASSPMSIRNVPPTLPEVDYLDTTDDNTIYSISTYDVNTL